MLGVEHILFGVDHLLFVLALLILVKGWRKLVGTITAFTVAHSITLAAATLGFVHVPSKPVEATIALSIVFVACEIVHRRQGRSGLTETWPWVIAFSFGLLHGLGFASALREVGLPQNAIPLALLFFNIGVELGQLLFIGVVMAVIALAVRAARNFSRSERRAAIRLRMVREHFGLRYRRRRGLLADRTNSQFCCVKLTSGHPSAHPEISPIDRYSAGTHLDGYNQRMLVSKPASCFVYAARPLSKGNHLIKKIRAMKTRRLQNLMTVALACLVVSMTTKAQAADPLASWNDGAAKQAIVEFVKATTTKAARSSCRPRSASPPSIRTARCGSSIRCTRR